MATVIFVDQENGVVCPTTLLKDHLKPANTGKPFFKSQPGKVVWSSSGTVQPRKSSGKCQHSSSTWKGGTWSEEFLHQLPSRFLKPASKPSKQSYRVEIEKCLPYHPEEFETFDVPEEHKLSHLYLAGVPLIVYENEAAKFGALSTLEPAPMDIPVFSWESDMSSILPDYLATLDEITLSMPKMEYCLF
ncbi:unnamed protein product [Staurois parvus]|uniref:Securin n=1 Tax=Staurois parvus TaxID=386267 RepID=A0ABN9HEL5_9NEOB|nr:unnamed protein product [Staurois parvus]